MNRSRVLARSVSGGRAFQVCLCWPPDDPPSPLRSSVDTGAGDRGGVPAEFAVVAETVGCRQGVGSAVLGKGGIEFEDTNYLPVAPNFARFRQKSLGDCTRPLLLTQGLEHRPHRKRSRTQRDS